MRPGTASARRSGAGVTARLIALVMLPVTVIALTSGSVVVSHLAASNEALAVDRAVVELSHLVALRDALQIQHTTAAFAFRAEQLGITTAVVSDFLGVELDVQVAPARAQAGRAIVALGAKSPITSAALAALYDEIDTGSINAAAAGQRLADRLETSDAALTRKLGRLGVEIGDADLRGALEALKTASGLSDVATRQGIDLSEIWFPTPGKTPGEAAAVLVRFNADHATFAAATSELHALGVEQVIEGLTKMDADARVDAFDRSVERSLGGSPLVASDLSLEGVIHETFFGYFVRGAMLDALRSTAAAAVRREARSLARAQRAALTWWAAGSLALALASIAIALGLARSISRPLKDLAAYARSVNGGDLDAATAGRRHRGPREVRLAFAVFADLVANLQLLDAKANALAHCDFEDQVLDEPFPGRLGRSLESSVALLSGSIVEREELQTSLAHEATHDSLTGICNRPFAITAIKSAFDRAARSGATTALLFVDLNDFKSVNDSHGHKVGDEVLRQVASRMAGEVRTGDVLARLGGDEFVVVVEGVEDAAAAQKLAHRLVDAIDAPFEIDGHRIRVGAAVGIALTLDGPEEPLHVLARADAAMYRAKQHESSAIEIFDAGLQRQMDAREEVESALTAALGSSDGGGLRLEYQPVLDAASGALVGLEALIRWTRPGHGTVMPDSFIPIAEATGLIIDVDCWVLAEVARQLQAWSADPHMCDIPIAVNISGRHLLSRRLAAHIRTALADGAIDPRRMSIEITETVLLADLVSAAAELDEVRALGIRVAIDDFGTGYTSLAHLQRLPVDTIKIDRSFISQLNVRRGSSLVRMVTDLGHAIDINIVAEGVETPDEMRALQAMGADHLQGYLLSRPLSPGAISSWVATGGEACGWRIPTSADELVASTPLVPANAPSCDHVPASMSTA